MTSYKTLLFSNKPISRLFIGTFVSSIGDWCRHVAIVGLAISCSGAGLKIAILLLLEVTPLLFVGPMSGVLIDRMSPRKIMIFCDVARAMLSLCFLFIKSGDLLWIAYILTALISIFDAPSQAAKQTLISKLASNEILVTTQSLFSLGSGLCIVIGAGMSAAIARIYGNYQVFVFDAATFMLSCCFLLIIKENSDCLKVSKKHIHFISDYFQDLKDGFRYTLSNSQARSILFFNTLRSIGSGVTYFLLGVFGYSVFNAGMEGVGAFHIAFGGGIFVGAILAKEFGNRIGWLSHPLLMGFAAMAEGLFVSLFSQMDTFFVALTVLTISYIGRSIVITLLNSLSSRLIDRQFMGRYFALNRVFTYTAMGITMFLCGYGLVFISARSMALLAGIFLSINGMLWIVNGLRVFKLSIETPEFTK